MPFSGSAVLGNSVFEIAPHITHCPIVKAIHSSDLKLTEFEYVLLNMRHPGWKSDPQLIGSLVEEFKNAK